MKNLIRTIRTDKICKIYNGRKVVNDVSISYTENILTKQCLMHRQ